MIPQKSFKPRHGEGESGLGASRAVQEEDIVDQRTKVAKVRRCDESQRERSKLRHEHRNPGCAGHARSLSRREIQHACVP